MQRSSARFLIAIVAVAVCEASAASSVRLDVRDFGAVGDGHHDDRPSIEAAQAALPPDGGTLYFPPGIYGIGGAPIVLRRSHLHLEGVGAGSILRKTQPGGPLLSTSASHPGLTDIRIRGLRFEFDIDPARASVEVAVLLAHGAAAIAIEDCEFWDVRDLAILLRGVDGAVVDRCRFASPGAARGTAVQIAGDRDPAHPRHEKSPRRILVRGSSFRYLRRGVVVAAKPTRGETAHDITVEGNHFDLGWWSIAAVSGNEGPSVRYGESTLVDERARFEDLGLRGAAEGLLHDVRAMPLRSGGTGRYTTTTLEDTGADFSAARVQPGEMVRTDDVFALVRQVESPQRLVVEEWLSRRSYLPTTPPPEGTRYTVHGIILGRGLRAGGTVLEVRRWAGWFDLAGRRVVPPPGTRYEVLVARPDYPCHAEGGTRRIAIRDNTFLRGWSDQVSVFGDEATITDNRIESGQDMGITVHGRHNLVARNSVRHQGAAGIWASVADSAIEENRVSGSRWVNPRAPGLAGLALRRADRTVVARNRLGD